jgi:hypothetical protein
MTTLLLTARGGANNTGVYQLLLWIEFGETESKNERNFWN